MREFWRNVLIGTVTFPVMLVAGYILGIPVNLRLICFVFIVGLADRIAERLIPERE